MRAEPFENLVKLSRVSPSSLLMTTLFSILSCMMDLWWMWHLYLPVDVQSLSASQHQACQSDMVQTAWDHSCHNHPTIEKNNLLILFLPDWNCLCSSNTGQKSFSDYTPNAECGFPPCMSSLITRIKPPHDCINYVDYGDDSYYAANNIYRFHLWNPYSYLALISLSVSTFIQIVYFCSHTYSSTIAFHICHVRSVCFIAVARRAHIYVILFSALVWKLQKEKKKKNFGSSCSTSAF